MARDKNSLKYVQVKHLIKEKIFNGEFDGQLPGERVLAGMFGISYMTVRHAVGELVDEKFLYKKPDKGVFVCKPGDSIAKTHNFGLFLPLDLIPDGIHDRYFSLVFKYLEHEAKLNDCNMLLFTRPEDIYPYSERRKVDGLVISYTWTAELEKAVRVISRYTPVVLIDNYMADQSIPAILINNYKESYNIVSYLISINHNRIGYVAGVQDSPVGRDKLQGYCAALVEHGLAVDSALIYQGDYSLKSGYESINHFKSLSPFPTAIVCASDTMAIGAIDGLKDSGLRVPGDVSIIGFDDIKEAAELPVPLSTVHVYLDELARYAVELLIRMQNHERIDTRERFIRAEFMLRASVKSN